MANPYRATTLFLLIGVVLAASVPPALAGSLGLRLAAEPPQRGPYAPATTGYPTEPSELSAAIAVLGALGLDALVVEPLATEAADGDAGTRSAAGLPEGAAERARLEIILAAADEAGIDVYLEGFDVLGSAEPTEAEAELIGDAISGALRYLGEHDSLAGFIWRAPEPVPLAGTPLPAEVATAADAWIRSMQALVTTLGDQCAEAGRTFVIATDSVPLVAAALPVLPPGVEVWRTATDLRDPTLEPQIAALEAATAGAAGGLWLDWE
ncbi:MAG: hypothetical protein GF320_13865, partial [Armatimonadia bacterium]|nr:hypothetical protein [Armatimonadia bacterium]